MMESQGDLLYYIGYALVIVWLGFKNWSLSSELEMLQEQNDIQHNLILSMAKELKSFGSPNVSVADTPTYNIKYDNQE
jgi:hypothetical protein